MDDDELHPDLYGWWRITETSQWVDDGLDLLGPALISITGDVDRLRMHCLLAYVKVKPTKSGASFTWEGAWEFDPMTGSGSVRLGKDGRLRGRIQIKNGDDSTFIAERTTARSQPIPSPPRYQDKWRSRGRWLVRHRSRLTAKGGAMTGARTYSYCELLATAAIASLCSTPASSRPSSRPAFRRRPPSGAERSDLPVIDD